MRRRWLRHLSNARKGLKTALANAIRKYGENDFIVLIIVEAVDFREAAAIERGLIASRRTMSPHGYNLSTGGEATMGRAVSEETRRKMSASAKARKRVPDSDEARRNKGLARSKVLASRPDLRARIGDFNRGKKKHLSDEVRRKISDRMKIVRASVVDKPEPDYGNRYGD